MNEELQKLIEKCLTELAVASEDNYDATKAERVAALFLMAQIKLISFLENVDFSVRSAKNNISRIEADKYTIIKMAGGDKKITEGSLVHSLAAEKEVQEAKQEYAKLEAEAKKWNYLVNSMKDGHLYFRSIAKQKQNINGFGE